MMLESHFEMLSVLAALVAAVVIPVIHALMIRLSNKKLVVSSTLVAFSVYVATYILTEFFYIGMANFTLRRFIAGVSTLSFIMLTYMECVSHIVRGFSMQMVIDAEIEGQLSLAQFVKKIGKGNGIDWLVTNRLEIMESLGLIKVKDNNIHLNWRSRFLGKLGILTKRVLKMGEGG